MDDLARPKEFQRCPDIGIIDDAQQILIDSARLLLGGEILVQVRERVAL